MGGGTWSTNLYSSISSARMAAGYKTAFTHTEDVHAGRVARGVHEALDPRTLNSAGENVRECRDSDEHPSATPIAVLFDVTGSMGAVPEILQTKLPQLLGLLQRKGYVEDPQILFGGIGDAYCDAAPLQLGQFESDNRMDENLELIFLEGGGGGGNHESYELAAYFMARHTRLDCWEKRDEKGYLFLIGDERVYTGVDPEQVRRLIGGISSEFSGPLSTRDLFRELQEKYEVYFLFARQGSYQPEAVIDASATDLRAIGWKELLGEQAISLDDAGAVCETIALVLGMREGIALDDGMGDLIELGADEDAVAAAGKALATVGGGGSSSAVAETSGDVPGLDADAGDSGSTRL